MAEVKSFESLKNTFILFPNIHSVIGMVERKTRENTGLKGLKGGLVLDRVPSVLHLDPVFTHKENAALLDITQATLSSLAEKMGQIPQNELLFLDRMIGTLLSRVRYDTDIPIGH